ncbi:MAG: hypothetical protein PSV35_04590, partial [bacterium]|nr:hypothetical protein [bacterium]
DLHKKYKIIRYFADTSYFMYFHRSYRGVNTNWKARLSIHPEDMNKAWEIILPILYQRDISFKVINLKAIEKFKNDRQKKLEKLIEEYNQFLQNSNSQDIEFLRTIFHRRYQELSAYGHSEWRLISFVQTYFTKLTSFFTQYNLNRENLFARTKNIYEQLIDLRKQKVTNGLRLFEGMQFTIYILPGLEKECQNTLEEIEDNLVKAKIRPGIMFPTDRQIGLYSSIRHPGKWIYHNATDTNLGTYNSDNIDDPFSFLKTIPTKEIVQEDEIQTMLEHRDTTQLIVSALRTKKFIGPSQLKSLAVFKEDVVKHIETLSLEIKRELITDCLDKSSNLGKFFRVQRGIFSPKLGHGTLKQLEDTHLTIN